MGGRGLGQVLYAETVSSAGSVYGMLGVLRNFIAAECGFYVEGCGVSSAEYCVHLV